MTNITGIVVREHSEQKYSQKFPKIVPWLLLAIGACMLCSYYSLLLWASVTVWQSIIMLSITFLSTLGSLWTLPTCTPEEYLIEITPNMRGIDLLDIEREFIMTKEGPCLYRCRRKGLKVM